MRKERKHFTPEENGVDGRAHRAKKKSWGTLTGNWVRMMCGIKSWISSGAGRKELRSASDGSSRVSVVFKAALLTGGYGIVPPLSP